MPMARFLNSLDGWNAHATFPSVIYIKSTIKTPEPDKKYFQSQ